MSSRTLQALQVSLDLGASWIQLSEPDGAYDPPCIELHHCHMAVVACECESWPGHATEHALAVTTWLPVNILREKLHASF